MCLKLDGGEYYGRKFLGVMAQMCNLNNMNEYSYFTLGCIELFERATGANIKKKLIEILASFGVAESQIMSITTDKARNYLNIAELINALAKVSTTEDSEESDFEYDELEIEEFIVMDDEEEENMYQLRPHFSKIIQTFTVRLFEND